jgi:pyruvate kinase
MRNLALRDAARASIRTLVGAGLLAPGARVVFSSGEHVESHGAPNIRTSW